jgi:thiamine-phosphate pyrophosphorylase
MLPNLTPAVARALEVAQSLARNAGAGAVEPRHLLLALLHEEEGRAATALTRAGVYLSAYAFTEPAPIGEKSVDTLPLGSLAYEVLTYAREVADELTGDRTIAGDHVVLALVRRDPELCDELIRHGLHVDRLESELAPHQPPLRLDEPLTLAESTEQIDTARILDASGNRAREALRVLEDYCRFSLDDRCLSSQLKQLRHDVSETLALLPVSLLLESRETLRDVGTALSTEDEFTRSTLTAVVAANWKRLTEALRSLEEYSKLRHPRLAERWEQFRYRCYTLERTTLLGTTARQRLADARLYLLVTGAHCTASLDWTIQEAAAGGVQVVQLREKGLPDGALLDRARKVREWTRKAGVLFIMNDRPDIARLAEADGVHLGQDELPVKEARRILGGHALVGVSTHDLAQVRQAVLDGASYIGVGPTFPSGTKRFEAFPGLDFVRAAATETTLPAFAIGGVNADNLSAVIEAGGRRIAVSQAICRADDPRTAASSLRRELDVAAKSK